MESSEETYTRRKLSHEGVEFRGVPCCSEGGRPIGTDCTDYRGIRDDSIIAKGFRTVKYRI